MESCSKHANTDETLPNEESLADSQESVPNREDLQAGTRTVRTISWEKAVRFFSLPHGNGRNGGRNGGRPAAHPSGQTPGVRFVHRVPVPLRDVGCMWLEQGYENQRCGKPVTWTMGADLRLARFYCEDHGQVIRDRRQRTNRQRRRRQARAEQEQERR